jgi:hypothetical protein
MYYPVYYQLTLKSMRIAYFGVVSAVEKGGTMMMPRVNLQRKSVLGWWLIRLVTWDGIFPAAILSVPFLLRWMFPNDRATIELAAVVLPIVAFFVRYRAGMKHIATHRSTETWRRIQVAVFGVGLIVLVVMDGVMILTHVMPKGAVVRTTADLVVWTSLYLFYFGAMAFAMFPGWKKSASDEDDYAIG